MSYLLVAIFCSIILLAIRHEYSICRSFYSPIFLLLISNIGITLLYYMTSEYLGFYTLCIDTLVVLLYGCFIFSVVSIIMVSYPYACKRYIKQRKLLYVDDYPSRISIMISFLTIIFMVVKMFSIGIDSIVEDDISASAFGGQGLSGHILVLQILLTTHFIGRRYNLSSSIAIFGMIFCLFMYNVKAWIIIPFILGVILKKNLFDIKIKFIYLLMIILSIFAIFSISYFITLGFDLDNMDFILAHFFKYLYAGIGGLNEALKMNYPIGLSPLFGTPPVVMMIFSLNYHTHSAFDYVIINDVNGEWTNVYSLLGGAYLFNGLFFGTIYLFVISIISYYLYLKQLNTNNYWSYLSYLLWSSGLIFSFFGNYYTLLNVWEFTFESYFLSYFCRKHNKSLL